MQPARAQDVSKQNTPDGTLKVIGTDLLAGPTHNHQTILDMLYSFKCEHCDKDHYRLILNKDNILLNKEMDRIEYELDEQGLKSLRGSISIHTTLV